MSEQNFEQAPLVQGMYCQVNDTGCQKCTVTMTDVSLTIYRTVNLFTFGMGKVEKSFNAIAQEAGTNIQRAQYNQDFTDLLAVCAKIQSTKMSLRSGDKIVTFTPGQPIHDEKTGYLELSPERPEWWAHPLLEPIVTSIQSYLPGFEPWLLQRDKYIGRLSIKSSLLSR